MITGFNTDINYNGVTYHVQTEDKGLKTPLILSLVYQGGTILASKRSPYDDLLADTFDEKVLEERLNRQHKLICAAIRAGRVEDLKRMTMKASSEKQKGLVVTKEVKKEVISQPVKKELPLSKENEIVAKLEKEKAAANILNVQLDNKDVLNLDESVDKIPVEKDKEQEIPKPNVLLEVEKEIPKPSEQPVWDIPVIEDVTIVEDVYVDQLQIIEEEIMLPSDAVEIVGDLEQFESLLADELKVKILGENKFNSGDRKNINILVCRGKEDSAVENANVMVKVIGSDFRPLIYHSKADSNGVATVFLKLPTFRSGRAAILVRAMVNGEETELRRAITPE